MNTPDLFQNVGLTSQKLVIYLRSEGGKIEKDQTAVAETSYFTTAAESIGDHVSSLTCSYLETHCSIRGIRGKN